MTEITAITAIVTIFGVFISNAALIIPLFLWIRTESRSDIRHMDIKLDANRELIREIHKESQNLIMAIREDMKDFHIRLINIEQNK